MEIRRIEKHHVATVRHGDRAIGGYEWDVPSPERMHRPHDLVRADAHDPHLVAGRGPHEKEASEWIDAELSRTTGELDGAALSVLVLVDDVHSIRGVRDGIESIAARRGSDGGDVVIEPNRARGSQASGANAKQRS